MARYIKKSLENEIIASLTFRGYTQIQTDDDDEDEMTENELNGFSVLNYTLKK